MKRNEEKEFYEEIKDWDFSKFEIESDKLTNWDLYEILNKVTNKYEVSCNLVLNICDILLTTSLLVISFSLLTNIIPSIKNL